MRLTDDMTTDEYYEWMAATDRGLPPTRSERVKTLVGLLVAFLVLAGLAYLSPDPLPVAPRSVVVVNQAGE